jgi:hypothetical protein
MIIWGAFKIKGAKCANLNRPLIRTQGKNVLMWLVIKVIRWTRRELFKIQKWNA